MIFVIIEVALAVLLYASATFALWQHHVDGAPYSKVIVLAAAGLVAHAVSLVHMIFGGGQMIIGVGAALSLFAWQTALLLWLFSLRRSIGALALVIYPLTALGAIAGPLVSDANGVRETLHLSAQAHIVLSMIAYGLLTLGAVQAIVLTVQHRMLRRRPPTGLFATLPPLQSAETLLYRLVGIGFFVLSLAIATGLVFIHHLFEQHLAHKLVLSVVAWVIFGVLLLGRWRYGWRGRVAARGLVSGYIVLALAYFGSKMVLEVILGEHW